MRLALSSLSPTPLALADPLCSPPADDADTLYPVLQRLLATPTLPSVILRGTPLGTFESLASLHAAGQLKALLDAADVRLATKPRKQAKAAKQANVHRRNRQ